jgi:hypothetical protein
MNKNKNIARGWKDVKLYQLQELNSLPEFEDKIDMMVEYLSILLNIDPTEVENMPINDLMVEFSRWEFLKELPKEKKIDIIKIDGKRFGVINFSEMTLAQMVDIEEYINGGGTIQNLHKILSVIYLPIDKYNVFTKRYTLKPYEPLPEVEEAFKLLDMSILYPTALFFYRIVQTYLKNSVLSLVQTKKQMMMEMISKEEELSQTQKQQLLKELEKLGTGIK